MKCRIYMPVKYISYMIIYFHLRNVLGHSENHSEWINRSTVPFFMAVGGVSQSISAQKNNLMNSRIPNSSFLLVVFGFQTPKFDFICAQLLLSLKVWTFRCSKNQDAPKVSFRSNLQSDLNCVHRRYHYSLCCAAIRPLCMFYVAPTQIGVRERWNKRKALDHLLGCSYVVLWMSGFRQSKFKSHFRYLDHGSVWYTVYPVWVVCLLTNKISELEVVGPGQRHLSKVFKTSIRKRTVINLSTLINCSHSTGRSNAQSLVSRRCTLSSAAWLCMREPTLHMPHAHCCLYCAPVWIQKNAKCSREWLRLCLELNPILG